jgi:hypothetical protein
VEVSEIFAAEKFFQKKVMKQSFEIEFFRVFRVFELKIKTKFFIFRKIEFFNKI